MALFDTKFGFHKTIKSQLNSFLLDNWTFIVVWVLRYYWLCKTTSYFENIFSILNNHYLFVDVMLMTLTKINSTFILISNIFI